MGEAKRRGKLKPTFEDFIVEAKGVLQCNVIRKNDGPAVEIFEFDLQFWLEHLKYMPQICLFCDAEFHWPKWLPESFFRVAPGVVTGEQPLVTMYGICPACDSGIPTAELMRRCIAAIREGWLIPDLRPIDIHQTTGKA